MPFRIERYEQALQPGQPFVPLDPVNASYGTRMQAQEDIRQIYLDKRGMRHGYNEEQDYWWCRQEGQLKNLILMIRSAE